MSHNEDYLHDKVKDPFDNLRQPFLRFLRIESSGGILLILATIAALVIANSAWGSIYESFWKKDFTIGSDFFHLTKPIILWINDGLMAIFFFLVGLEIKRELVAGELSSQKKAALPIIAAIGGMLIPAGLFLLFNRNGQGLEGWGIPMATDIAFSLGILSLLGKRVPLALKVFLVAFAIVDDIGAVLVIAFFYSAEIHWSLLFIALALLAILFIFNMRNIRFIPFYMIIGWVIWYLFLKAGIHPTIAGVLIAFSIPSTRKIRLKDFTKRMNRNLNDFGITPCKDSVTLNHQQLASIDNMQSQIDKVQSPLQSLEHNLHGFVTYFIMPLFAFANAGVVLNGAGLASFNTLTLSITGSLILGKIAGIFIFSYITVKLGISALPQNINWKHIFGAGMLGGIGFTMSLFISNLAYTNIILINQAKLGILLGSLIAALLGFFYLKMILKEKV